MFATIPTSVCAQAGAAATAAAAAAIASSNAALYFSRSQQDETGNLLRVVNHLGTIDLSNRKICIVPKNSYVNVNNCSSGDVVVVRNGTLYQIMEVCKLDEPVYSYKGDFACVYEDHEKKFYIAPEK